MTNDVVLLLSCLPIIVAMTAGKIAIAMFLAERINFYRNGDRFVVYSIYRNDKLKFSTNIKREADDFYLFMCNQFGKLSIRLEEIKV